MIQLIDVYSEPAALDVLWRLLKEREPHQNISHREMPSYNDHVAFIASRPYAAWSLVKSDGEYVGAIYLTKNNEIGLFLFRRFHRQGIASEALKIFMTTNPRGQYYANINPNNAISINFFRKHGFHLIQQTYKLETTQ